MSVAASYTRQQLETAVAESRSWRGVLRALGRPGPSAGTLRAVRRRVDAFGIDHSHFTGQRRWTDRELIEAVATSLTWSELLERVRLADSPSNIRAARAHAHRLGVDSSHFNGRPPQRVAPARRPGDVRCLRTAGSTMAAAWFLLRGYEVLWPLEPCRYDLAVRDDGGVQRVQVKTTTSRNHGTYVARISNTRAHGQLGYDIDEIDSYFVIDADLNAYLIPFADVSGYQQLYLRHYRPYLVAGRGQWLTTPLAPTASPAAPAP